MNIHYSPYKLCFKGKKQGLAAGSYHEGALLRVQFEDGLVGYADCHPWPELGDLPLKGQLERCRLFDEWTPLIRNSLFCARLDAEGRDSGIHLLDELQIFPNHALVTEITTLCMEESVKEGFTLVKVKAGPQDLGKLREILPVIESLYLKLRIDFNGRLSHAEFNDFLQATEPFHACIDFIEDPPCVVNIFNVRIASDRSNLPEADITIIKPAVFEGLKSKEEFHDMVVTSYLDHPVGQVFAAFQAGVLNKMRPLMPCGLLSHRVYESTPYSEQLGLRGPYMSKSFGTGVGFDELLQRERWILLDR